MDITTVPIGELRMIYGTGEILHVIPDPVMDDFIVVFELHGGTLDTERVTRDGVDVLGIQVVRRRS